MRGTATIVRRNLPDFIGPANLYRLDPPMADENGMATFYAVASGVDAYSGPETLIFAADSSGKVKSFMDLRGSLRGGIDPDAAIRNAGYDVADEEE